MYEPMLTYHDRQMKYWRWIECRAASMSRSMRG